MVLIGISICSDINCVTDKLRNIRVHMTSNDDILYRHNHCNQSLIFNYGTTIYCSTVLTHIKFSVLNYYYSIVTRLSTPNSTDSSLTLYPLASFLPWEKGVTYIHYLQSCSKGTHEYSVVIGSLSRKILHLAPHLKNFDRGFVKNSHFLNSMIKKTPLSSAYGGRIFNKYSRFGTQTLQKNPIDAALQNIYNFQN